MKKNIQRLSPNVSDKDVIWETKGYIDFIDILNILTEGGGLPKKIVYDDIVYTNVSRTNTNLLYYCIEKDCPDEFKYSNCRIFKTVMKNRKPGETDIDMLNRKIGIIEW